MRFIIISLHYFFISNLRASEIKEQKPVIFVSESTHMYRYYQRPQTREIIEACKQLLRVPESEPNRVNKDGSYDTTTTMNLNDSRRRSVYLRENSAAEQIEPLSKRRVSRQLCRNLAKGKSLPPIRKL